MSVMSKLIGSATLGLAVYLGAAACGGDKSPLGPGPASGSDAADDGGGSAQLFNLKDRETGTVWDFDGRALSGPLVGKALTQIPAHNAMWFAWLAFWGDTEVYGSEQRGSGQSLGVASQIPSSNIYSGGVAPDGIPALTDPATVAAAQSPWQDSDRVFGVTVNGEARAYPQNLGWWHEIINDVVGGHPICVTYCPLTGSALVFDGQDAQGERITFGVSGLLLNSNLIMYDRRDRSTLFPQMIYSSFGQTPQSLVLLPVTETSWGVWKRLHPDTRIVSAQTGWSMDYSQYPYGSYRQDGEVYYALAQDVAGNSVAGLYHPKEMVLGIRGRNGTARAYPFATMGDRAALNETLDGEAILIVWSAQGSVAVPFQREVDGRTLTFDIVGS